MKKLIFSLFFLFALNIVAQRSEKLEAAIDFQREINVSFNDPDSSPLTPEDLKTFQELEFFPVDTTFYIIAEFVRTPFETPFEMPTTTERKPMYLKYGEAFFNLKGKEFKLNLYQNLELTSNPEYRNYLFMPFTDLTNGKTSYAGGRYIDMQIPTANKVIIDFNQAYNPYCAYNGKYSCPIPPEENHLEMEITAGVKNYIH